jgi:RecB family endonuclease NucS
VSSRLSRRLAMLPAMRLVIARCSVDYAGRLSSTLASATRLLIVKADGAVLVHSDAGGYKPLNWMTAPCLLIEEEGVWRVSNKAGETMTIRIEEVFADTRHDLGVDPGLVKDGVERDLQLLLADQCHVLGDGWTLVSREYQTDIGPVDLLCRDHEGAYVAVEIKRRGEIDGVEQLKRYLVRRERSLGPVAGVLAAQEFKPQAKVLAADRGIRCVQLDYDALRGMESPNLKLF